MKRPWIVAALLFLAVLVSFSPALRAGWIWDDDQYVTENPLLNDADGLARIWTQPRATPQYYPMTHTSFWVEHQLWGLSPTGYHVVNLLLHGFTTVMLFFILRRIGVPAPWLAAGLFALHPLQAESVAWVTERKNVLAGAFAMLAVWKWLDYSDAADQPRPLATKAVDPTDNPAENEAEPEYIHPLRHYGVASAFVLLALLSKTMAAVVPVALLLMLWWRHDRLPWKRAASLVPWLVVAMALGLFTRAMEMSHVGAIGSEWTLGETPLGEFTGRTLLVGQTTAFYLWKFLWPIDLRFVYPKWTVDPTVAWQWLPIVVIGIALVLLITQRRRIGRGPAAIALLFLAAAFPALGYFNVFPFRYTWVQDHFIYLAYIAPAIAIAWVLSRLPDTVTKVVGIILLVAVGARSFTYTPVFADNRALFESVLDKQPDNWMALTNLGRYYARSDQRDTALQYYDRALVVAPQIYDVQYNAGMAERERGNLPTALKHFLRAIELEERFVDSYVMAGQTYLELDQPGPAFEWFAKAAVLMPDLVRPHQRMAELNIAFATGLSDDDPRKLPALKNAAGQYQTALSAGADMGVLLAYAKLVYQLEDWENAQVAYLSLVQDAQMQRNPVIWREYEAVLNHLGLTEEAATAAENAQSLEAAMATTPSTQSTQPSAAD